MKKLMFILSLGLTAITAEAQNLTTTVVQLTNAPRTYFESINATPDTLLLKGSTVIGNLGGEITYPVEIRAERVTNPQTTNNVYAVSLRTKFDEHFTQVDYIDYDELDPLIRGVQSIAQATSTVTPMDNFEAVFRTRSGLSIAKLGRGNKVVIAITPGYTNIVRNQMASFVLDDLGRNLTAAKAKIDNIIASGQ
jgi:hypothetical protein